MDEKQQQQRLKQLRYKLDMALILAERSVRFRRRQAQKYRGMKGFEKIVARNQYEADRLNSTIILVKENLKRLDDKGGKYIE